MAWLLKERILVEADEFNVLPKAPKHVGKRLTIALPETPYDNVKCRASF
jgi:hypothetical protein